MEKLKCFVNGVNAQGQPLPGIIMGVTLARVRTLAREEFAHRRSAGLAGLGGPNETPTIVVPRLDDPTFFFPAVSDDLLKKVAKDPSAAKYYVLDASKLPAQSSPAVNGDVARDAARKVMTSQSQGSSLMKYAIPVVLGLGLIWLVVRSGKAEA